MSKYNKKRSFRFTTTTKIILSVIASCLIMTLLFGVYTGHQQWKMRNDENLITLDGKYLKSMKLDSGLEVNVDDDGVIRLRGIVEDDETLTVASVSLPAGTYTLGGYNCDEDSDVTLVVKVGEVAHYAGSDDKTFGATFTLSETTNVNVEIHVKKDTNLLVTKILRPTIAEGKDQIDFYK